MQIPGLILWNADLINLGVRSQACASRKQSCWCQRAWLQINFEKHYPKLSWSKELSSVSGDLIESWSFEEYRRNVFWKANVTLGHNVKMYKMYKLGGRNTSQIWLLITVCSKQAAEVLTEIGLESDTEWGALLEVRVVGRFPLYFYWAYYNKLGSMITRAKV